MRARDREIVIQAERESGESDRASERPYRRLMPALRSLKGQYFSGPAEDGSISFSTARARVRKIVTGSET